MMQKIWNEIRYQIMRVFVWLTVKLMTYGNVDQRMEHMRIVSESKMYKLLCEAEDERWRKLGYKISGALLGILIHDISLLDEAYNTTESLK